MASPAQLVETVSRETGVPLATLVDIDRKLVKADLRGKGGRGLNVARMTPLDAARLLTAVLASPQANLAAEAVNRYAQTRVDRDRSSQNAFATADLPDMIQLPARHSFVEAAAALIASAATGSLAQLVKTAAADTAPRLELYAFTRATRGRIRISGMPSGLTTSVEYALPRSASRTAAHADAGDLEQSRRITERTILAVAHLLAKEE